MDCTYRTGRTPSARLTPNPPAHPLVGGFWCRHRFRHPVSPSWRACKLEPVDALIGEALFHRAVRIDSALDPLSEDIERDKYHRSDGCDGEIGVLALECRGENVDGGEPDAKDS